MQDHYQVLSVDPKASSEEVKAAFDQALASRRARRQKTSDVHVALAVLGDPTLRRAYDLARAGEAVTDKLVYAKAVTIDAARDSIPDVHWGEVRRHAWQTLLRTTVLVTGATARAADVTGSVSRGLQHQAAKRITR